MRRIVERFWCNPDCTTCWTFFFIQVALVLAAMTFMVAGVVSLA